MFYDNDDGGDGNENDGDTNNDPSTDNNDNNSNNSFDNSSTVPELINNTAMVIHINKQ